MVRELVTIIKWNTTWEAFNTVPGSGKLFKINYNCCCSSFELQYMLSYFYLFSLLLVEKEMATHSSILAWRIPRTTEPGGLLSIGLHRARHNWSDLACMHALEKEMATHSSVLAWRIPGMVESGGLPSMGSHGVGYNWSNLAATAAEEGYDHMCHGHPSEHSVTYHWHCWDSVLVSSFLFLSTGPCWSVFEGYLAHLHRVLPSAH